ncbi:ATP-binding cassette domain-containing protein [Kamptonema cortianum]|jgi:ABC-type multidrug transport system ATPase subunit|nr:ATP-binding cassette domain-containing protein [Geitlerinema splendidum]MDK3154987.1 ATP-binding cassette domain-containing protein [Kamptonema cortianum]
MLKNKDAIRITSLGKTFPDAKKVALDNINAVIRPGIITGLIGPDGAGKTTLLRLMAGLLLPSYGKINVFGLDTIQDAERLHDITGYMPQKFGLYEDLTVIENLNLYAALHGISEKEKPEIFDKMLHFTSLGPFTNRVAGNLSGGMKQKLGLACSLLGKPKALFLDEPSVGVDPVSRRELWKMVSDLATEGICVVWSTSYLDEADRCSEILLLNEGKLLFYGPPKDLTKQVNKKELGFEEAFIEILGGSHKGESVLAKHMSPKIVKDVPPIQAENLTKKFGDFTAARDISFTIKQGEIFGLLGPNGAGKSTIFKMLCGLLQPTKGHALVSGYSLKTASSEARSRIGYMAQKFSLYGDLSVSENLNFFSGVYGLLGRHRQTQMEQMISIFELTPYLGENAGLLPLGYKQRLALACSLMHDPDVLFLDEPTSGVDPLVREEFWNHIQGMATKGVTIMVTTHFMEEAEYCDRIALIYGGSNIALGTPMTLKKMVKSKTLPSPTLEDAFITLIEKFDQREPL